MSKILENLAGNSAVGYAVLVAVGIGSAYLLYKKLKEEAGNLSDSISKKASGNHRNPSTMIMPGIE